MSLLLEEVHYSDRVLRRRADCYSGSGGLTVANQIYNRFKAAGKPLNPGDVGVLDAAEYHYYQVSAQIQP